MSINNKKIFEIVKIGKKNCESEQNIGSKAKTIKNHKNPIKNFDNKEKVYNKFFQISNYNSKRLFFGSKNNKNNAINDINKKNKENDFLGKKRDLFKIDIHKDFSIFHFGDYNADIRKIIQNLLDNQDKESSKTIAESENNKKKKKIKIKNVRTRKDNADNIRKKIKSRFLKHLRNAVNERLKSAGSEKFFKLLPQIFITDISRVKNKIALDLSFKEIFSKNFFKGTKINKNISDIFNYYHNISVLEYLEGNKEIGEKSNFNTFKNMKFRQIFNEYLKSRQFEMEIASLMKKNENDKYIENYIIKARDLIDFFVNK